MISKPIKGVIPPMITPFKENGDVDFEGHVENMQHWNEDQLAGYLVLGSNSETVYLNEEEKLKLVDLTVKHAKKDRIILAGTGLESARETITLTNKTADLGADAALILTPSYYYSLMNERAQISYFTEVANQTKIPILIYNVTAFTQINITVAAVRELSRHPNIIGMKDSTGNVPQLVSFLDVMADNFDLIVGTASAWYPALGLGIEAGIFALANCSPNECTQVQIEFDQGNLEDAKETYLRMFPVNAAVTAQFGVAGLKYACKLLGYKGGFVRNPLLPLTEDEKENIQAILKRAQLI
jgi:4-hydroxy-2-oxoglutarate aldolase